MFPSTCLGGLFAQGGGLGICLLNMRNFFHVLLGGTRVPWVGHVYYLDADSPPNISIVRLISAKTFAFCAWIPSVMFNI